MNFPYHIESVSQPVDHFKRKKKYQKNVGKKLIIFREGGGGTPLAENFAKIINFFFDPFPC